jgi:membrane fusion protein (multidrug efflux system)
MSTIVEVDTGHVRGLPDFVTKLLGRSGGKDHE